jgi:hypothetical protein
MPENPFLEAREAFCQTVALKLQQLYTVVPKGSNPKLTGDFIESLVRGFVQDWIAPCQLLAGTLSPQNRNPDVQDPKPLQIDGIAFDPRLGPPVIRENGFIVAHPQFCAGVIEIKTSCDRLRDFHDRLTTIHRQYFRLGGMIERRAATAMGIVIHDLDPERHSEVDWFADLGTLHEPRGEHPPIYILFREAEAGAAYEPYVPAIDALMEAIFYQGWALDPRVPKLDERLRAQWGLTLGVYGAL